MEFNQAMTKMPSGPKKEVAYTGTQSIIGGRFNGIFLIACSSLVLDLIVYE